MEKVNLGNVILFKEAFIGGLTEHELYGTSNESGNWVSYNDICELLCFNRNLRKKVRRRINEVDKCVIQFERINKTGHEHDSEELFVRDVAVYDIIMKDREERKVTEQFIFDVLGQLNGGAIQSYVDIKYAKEIQSYKDWLESDNKVFMSYKNEVNIDSWSITTMEEAVDLIYKYLEQE